MKLYERLKKIDFNKYDLNDKEREVIDNALIEIALRVDDIDLIKKIITENNTFKYKTIYEQPLEVWSLGEYEEFSYLINDDEKLESKLYNQLLDTFKTPLDLEYHYSHMYKFDSFDPILMLFVIALEEKDLKLYIEEFIFATNMFEEYGLISRAEDLKKLQTIKVLLESGAVISKDEYKYCENEEIKMIYKEHSKEKIQLNLDQPIFKQIEDSPSYRQIKEWIQSYKSIYLVTSDSSVDIAEPMKCQEKAYFVELNCVDDIFHLINAEKNYYGFPIFIIKEANSKVLEEFKKQVNYDNIKQFLLEHSLLYRSSEKYPKVFLAAAIAINCINYRIPYTAEPEYRERTEADFWSDVYEHAKEYNENH